MNDETFTRAKKLKADIEHYKWQLKNIDELGKSSDNPVVNEDTKQFILGYLAGEYTRLLNKAVKEFEVL